MPVRVGHESAGILRNASDAETPTSKPDCPIVPAVSWNGGANASPSVEASRWNRACAPRSPGSTVSPGWPSQRVQFSGSGCPSFQSCKSLSPAKAAAETKQISSASRTRVQLAQDRRFCLKAEA